MQRERRVQGENAFEECVERKRERASERVDSVVESGGFALKEMPVAQFAVGSLEGVGDGEEQGIKAWRLRRC